MLQGSRTKRPVPRIPNPPHSRRSYNDRNTFICLIGNRSVIRLNKIMMSQASRCYIAESAEYLICVLPLMCIENSLAEQIGGYLRAGHDQP